jgi:beta-glucosidase
MPTRASERAPVNLEENDDEDSNGSWGRRAVTDATGRVATPAMASLVVAALVVALLGATAGARSDSIAPYALPVVTPPAKSSPPVDPAAPYTPTVRRLIDQLLPDAQPTAAQLAAAAQLLSSREGSNPSCHALAESVAPLATTPRIMPMCFSDGLGVQVYPNRSVTAGARAIQTTGLPSRVLLGSTFDPELVNAVGRVEGAEGRGLMVTGLLGPQVDTDVFVNWHRGVDTPGEDPYLNGVIGAAEVNGIQGQGLLAQLKHFAGYNGTSEKKAVAYQDQALHELILTPYEHAVKQGGVASVMCSYQTVRNLSKHLPGPVDALAPASPYAEAFSVRTWPLDEAHWSCEQPLILTYVLRNLWGSAAFVGTDYGAAHSTHAVLQGQDREDPSADYFGDSLVNAVASGTVPLAVFKQALARVLYQQERFGMLGCDNATAGCANPGGVGGDRSGTAPLPIGATGGVPVPGTRNGGAAIVEKAAEEGAVLLKNVGGALPISARALRGGIAVSGGGAEYLIASPSNEGAEGYAERAAINPLQQLQALSGNARAFRYTPANAPTGRAVPCSLLSGAAAEAAPAGIPAGRCGPASGLARQEGASTASMVPAGVDAGIDFTALAKGRSLAGGRAYRWDGWLYVSEVDRYVFRLQHSRNLADERVRFAFDGRERTLQDAYSFYQGQYYGLMSTRVNPTNAGYIEAGLRNRQCATADEKPAAPPPGPPAQAAAGPAADGPAGAASAKPPVVRCEDSPSVGWHRVSISVDATGLDARERVSLRLATSRRHADIAAAAEDAAHAALALVFVNDQGRAVVCQGGPCGDSSGRPPISSLQPEQIELIQAVAARNANTVVVLNTGTPVIVKEWIDLSNVKAVLNLWHAGQEGGTATARLLLGHANPSGHTSLTWPRDNGDTLYGYAQPRGLYAGDTPGAHPERLNGLASGDSEQTQGIYSGYRYYDQLGIPVQFPFGFGLSYTTFAFAGLEVSATADGGADVSFEVRNTGKVRGTEVAQIYVGPGPELSGVQQAVRSLAGFARVDLAAGEARRVRIHLEPRAFQYWSETQQRWLRNAPRRIYAGDANAPERLPLSAVAGS